MKIFLYILLFFLNFKYTLALESKIIYKIENEIITNIDIKNEYKYLLALNNELQKLDNEKKFNISKNSIIMEKIKKVEILKNFKDLNINTNYLNRVIESIYLKIGLNSLTEFKIYLKEYNIKIEEIEEKLTIDALWNEIIIEKYSSKIDINAERLKAEIGNNNQLTSRNYLLSEIVFEIKNKMELDEKYNLVKKNIEEIGFENTSSTFSVAESRKNGGNIGWVNEQSLNQTIKKNLLLLNKGDISKPFFIPSGVLILKINDIKNEVKKRDLELELKDAINYQKNKQLNQYSKIYFDKIKKNIEFNE